MSLITLALAFSVPQISVPAPALIIPLHHLIRSGAVTVTNVRGSGASTGPVLTATLVNNRDSSFDIDVHLGEAIYFEPGRAAAQRMVATAVYEREGGYNVYEGDPRKFIQLSPRGRLPVTFMAYCIDYERENPGESDSFTLRRIPDWFTHIADMLMAHERTAQTERSHVAAQLALWLERGLTADTIQETFPFEPGDLAAAQRIVNRNLRR